MKPKKIANSHEDLMCKILQEILPNHIYIRNGYYSFLMSPKKQPMQLDIYFPDLKLAYEYNGRQHYSFSKHFFNDKSQFEYLRKCDRLKKKKCKELGITLVTIDYTKKLTPEYLRSRTIRAGRRDVFGEQ